MPAVLATPTHPPTPPARQAYSGGWLLDPLYTGDWTESRKAVLGAVLPAFTPEQKALLLENKQDLIALQHYTGTYGQYTPDTPPFNCSACLSCLFAGLGWAAEAPGCRWVIWCLFVSFPAHLLR